MCVYVFHSILTTFITNFSIKITPTREKTQDETWLNGVGRILAVALVVQFSTGEIIWWDTVRLVL